MTLKETILLSILTLTPPLVVFGQTDSWDVKLSNSFQDGGGFKNFRAEGNFYPLAYLGMGAYLGYSMGKWHSSIDNSNFLTENSPNYYYALHFGAQISFHPLALWLKQKKKTKLDFWIGFKIGDAAELDVFLPGTYHYILGTYDPISGIFSWEDIYYSRDKKYKRIDHVLEYGGSLGLAYYLKIGLGFYVEYTCGHYLYAKFPEYIGDLRWGISYAF